MNATKLEIGEGLTLYSDANELLNELCGKVGNMLANAEAEDAHNVREIAARYLGIHHDLNQLFSREPIEDRRDAFIIKALPGFLAFIGETHNEILAKNARLKNTATFN